MTTFSHPLVQECPRVAESDDNDNVRANDPTVISLDGVGLDVMDGDVRRRILNNIDLSIGLGEFVAVMGPSGAGKSSLLWIAAGLVGPSSGRASVLGMDLAPFRESATHFARFRREILGYVEQYHNLIGELTAAENVGLPIEFGGAKKSEARTFALAALADVGLEDRADTPARLLSGGEQQRVAIARSLIGTRRILIADEPTASLDSSNGDSVMRLLRRRSDEGAAVLMATHNPEHAAWADRVVYLRDGAVV
jgi:putative ABC transport system ATP-binding protein